MKRDDLSRSLVAFEQKGNGFKDTKISRHETRSTVIMDVFTRFPCQVRTHQNHRACRLHTPRRAFFARQYCAPDGHGPFNVWQPRPPTVTGSAAADVGPEER
jgi:hypothetical protein